MWEVVWISSKVTNVLKLTVMTAAHTCEYSKRPVICTLEMGKCILCKIYLIKLSKKKIYSNARPSIDDRVC